MNEIIQPPPGFFWFLGHAKYKGLLGKPESWLPFSCKWLQLFGFQPSRARQSWQMESTDEINVHCYFSVAAGPEAVTENKRLIK